MKTCNPFYNRDGNLYWLHVRRFSGFPDLNMIIMKTLYIMKTFCGTLYLRYINKMQTLQVPSHLSKNFKNFFQPTEKETVNFSSLEGESGVLETALTSSRNIPRRPLCGGKRTSREPQDKVLTPRPTEGMFQPSHEWRGV